MSYTFQSTIYDTKVAVCDAIVEDWITSGGQESSKIVDELIEKRDANSLALECVGDWDLLNPDDDRLSGVTVEDLQEAFIRFAENRPDLEY